MTTTGAGSKRRGGPDSPEKPVKKAKAASTKANSVTDSGKGKSRAAGEHRTKVTGTFSNDGHSKNSTKAVMRAATGKRAYEIGPVLLNSTDFVPPRDIEYTLHHKARQGEGSGGQGASLEDRLVFSGESDSIDYVAWNCDTHGVDGKSRREARGYSGEYMVGVYDPANSTVTLRAAPIFTLGRSVKSLTNLSLDASSNTRDWQERIQARRGLGETFGNRKTKLKARNDDRMKVDTSNMLDVMGTMQEGIEEATQHLPSEEKMKEEADQARPIPPPNLLALTPQEAYPLDLLIPDAIFRLLNVKSLQSVESSSQVGRHLPLDGPNRSTWLKDRMWPLIQVSQLAHNKQDSKKITFDDDGSQLPSSSTAGILKSAKGVNRDESKVKLKILLYIALAWGFIKQVAGRRDKGGDKEALLKKLKLDQVSAGEAILDDLFERFTQTERGSSRGQMTGFTETKLYAYIFALCLHFENFSLDPSGLARDLGLGPAKVTEIFRSLGCTPAKKSVMQADGTSKQERMLVLKCPLELPKPRKGRQPAK